MRVPLTWTLREEVHHTTYMSPRLQLFAKVAELFTSCRLNHFDVSSVNPRPHTGSALLSPPPRPSDAGVRRIRLESAPGGVVLRSVPKE